MSRAISITTVSTTAMFLMEGYCDAEERRRANRSDNRPAYIERTGVLETVRALAAYAEISERELMRRNPQNFPGVYDYEVSSSFGDWWYSQMVANGEPPTKQAGTAELMRRIDEFFAQGAAT